MGQGDVYAKVSVAENDREKNIDCCSQLCKLKNLTEKRDCGIQLFKGFIF